MPAVPHHFPSTEIDVTAAPRIGEPAPQLRLPDLDGEVTALDDPAGSPVLVSFLRHAG